MDKVPLDVIGQMYSYDPTYRNIFGKVVIPLKVHCLFTDVLNVTIQITSVLLLPNL